VDIENAFKLMTSLEKNSSKLQAMKTEFFTSIKGKTKRKRIMTFPEVHGIQYLLIDLGNN
jgi:elongation factor P--beta-lysine ligase